IIMTCFLPSSHALRFICEHTTRASPRERIGGGEVGVNFNKRFPYPIRETGFLLDLTGALLRNMPEFVGKNELLAPERLGEERPRQKNGLIASRSDGPDRLRRAFCSARRIQFNRGEISPKGTLHACAESLEIHF